MTEFVQTFYKKLIIGSSHDRLELFGFKMADPHKVLGFSALFHYLTRYALYIMYGTMMFSRSSYDLIFVVGHLMLSCSSFLFPVSKRRNYNNQIIWRELQLHNIVFTARSCLIITYDIYFPEQNMWTRFAIVMSCHYIADLVTTYYKEGSTMRDMAQDNSIFPKWSKIYLDRFYSMMQFGATASLIIPNYCCHEHAFMIMFAIQISTFLMTMRLKGLINNDVWHLFYAASLLMTFHIASTCNTVNYYTREPMLLFYIWRIYFRLNKYVGWFVIMLAYDYIVNRRFFTIQL